uniref:C2H2-type domain-containing protein n=1 Tax=Romanomermis culicivorax TaxID=13658 RepID=A0A915KVT9_ROMCU
MDEEFLFLNFSLPDSGVHIDQPWKILHKSKIDIEIKVRQMVQNSKAPSNNHNAEKLDSEIDQNLVADDDVNPDCKRIKIQNFNKTMNKNLADHSKKNFASGGSAIKIGPSTGGILSSLLRGDLVPQQTALTTDNKFSCSAIANHSSPFLSSPAASNVDEDSLLICGFCEESVSHNAVSVLRHLKAHARFGTYNCSLCESMCSNLAEFEFHLTQSHGTSSSPKFPPIVDFLARAKRFRRDETIRLVETAFGRTANGIGRVNTARIKCHLCCEMVNWRRDALVSHLRSHLGLSPYICARCSSSFVDHASMYDHFAAKHLGAEADFFTFAYNFDPKADTDLDGAYEKCFPALSTKLLEELCGENRVDSVIQTYLITC